MKAQVEKIFLRIKQQFLVPLYANAYALIFNQIVSAALGMLYWAMVARLYSADIVGQNTAIISTMLFLSALAEFSLKSAMTRFVPRAGNQVIRLLVYTYLVIVVAAFFVTLAFFTLGRHFGFTSALLADTRVLPLLLFFVPVLWIIFYIQDGILVGLREAKWVLYENAIYNILKIVLLLGLFLFSDNRYSIAASWFLPTPFMILLVNGFIFLKFIPNYLIRNNIQSVNIKASQIVSSVAGDHIGTIFAETCVRLLPLLVLNLLGKSDNAYFYQAWLVGNTIYLIASNLISSFSVEASSNLRQIIFYSRRILLEKMRLIVPLAAGVFLLAPLVLRIFGEDYAENGAPLLRWLALAAFPMILNIWYLGYARVLGRMGGIIRNQAVTSFVTLGLSYLWLPRFGIASVGIAWFIAQLLVTVIVLYEIAPLLMSGRNTDLTGDSDGFITNRFRRVDWRFLTSIISPQRSVVFNNAGLFRSVELITTDKTTAVQDMDGRNTDKNVNAGMFDLAVAVNPNHVTLKSACNMLQPKGVFYTEWTGWRVGGAKGVRSRLRRAGFEAVKLFYAYPSVEHPILWFPLDSANSSYMYLAYKFMPGDDGWQAFIRKMITLTMRIFIPTGLVPTLSAVAYKNLEAPLDVMELVRNKWQNQTLKVNADLSSYIMQTGGTQLFSKIIYLIFSPDNPMPECIVKLPRKPEDGETIKNEENILQALRATGFQNSSDILLPDFLFSCEWNGSWLSAQVALKGMPIDKLIKNETFQNIADRFTDWQIAFAKFSQKTERYLSLTQVLDEILSKLELIGMSRLTSEELADVRKILSGIQSVPLVCAHNDFVPWNIVDSKDGLGVFDWADSNWNSLPLLDLVYGLVNLVFLSEDTWDVAHKVRVYASILDKQTVFGEIFDRCLNRYAVAVGISPKNIAPLRLATWIIHCYFEYLNHKIETAGVMLPFESECFPLFRAELQAIIKNRSEITVN